jgi:hypothetical protein
MAVDSWFLYGKSKVPPSAKGEVEIGIYVLTGLVMIPGSVSVCASSSGVHNLVYDNAWLFLGKKVRYFVAGVRNNVVSSI